MGKKYNCHTDSIFLSLGQLKVTDLINTNRAILVKKLKLNYLPNSLEPIFNYKSSDERSSREQCCFKISDGKKYINNNFPLEEICRTWNALPVGIKNTTKLKPFKKVLTSHYLQKYDTTCSKPNCYPCSQSNFN